MRKIASFASGAVDTEGKEKANGLASLALGQVVVIRTASMASVETSRVRSGALVGPAWSFCDVQLYSGRFSQGALAVVLVLVMTAMEKDDGWMGRVGGRRQGGICSFFLGLRCLVGFWGHGLILNFRCQRRRTSNRVKVLSRRWRRLDGP
jgi:hypothetical protein